MIQFTTKSLQTSGIPLGGIGTGSVEIRPDGEFHEWQISNQEKWAKCVGGSTRNVDDGENLAGALSFYLRTEGEDNNSEPVRVRRLGFGLGHGQDREEYNYRMFSWIKPVEEIQFTGKFPVAELEFIDEELPVEVVLEAINPFTPHDHKTAGTPGFYLKFRIKNRSNKKVKISLAGKLRNLLINENRDITRVNKIETANGITSLNMEVIEHWGHSKEHNNGSVSLSVRGGNPSWITGDYAAYMNEYVANGEYGVVEESFLFALRREGKLQSTKNEVEYKDPIPNDDDLKGLSEERLDYHLEKLLECAFAQSVMDRVLNVKKDLLKTREGKIHAVSYLRTVRDALAGHHADTHGPWGDGALCSDFELEAGETQTVDFVFSWYFPNHYSSTGDLQGHMYENFFGSAKEVNRFLAKNLDVIPQKAINFANNLLNTSFDPAYADAWSIHLATLVKCSWWIKSGEFGIWEGLGSCGFHTTDITYHGSFGIISLFPELQKAQMEMGAKFQREDGRVHHFFTPDFSAVDDGFNRVDMNPQFVLLLCRDYLYTGDKEYIKNLWTNIVKAMDSIAQLDSDGDGLPDTGTKRNTYDAWNFYGNSTYISGLWLASLKAAVILAEEIGDSENAGKWTEIFEKGILSFDKALWNGDYYRLWVDGENRDECCMTNQLDGEWFARMIGLNNLLPTVKLETAMKSILKYNFSGENGLINATYPAGTDPTIYTYRNCQAEANWTGVEYSMAALCIMLGMEDNARKIVKNVDKRYRRIGQVWNHAECGDHYYRPLSSWALMQALTGFFYNAANISLTISKTDTGIMSHGPWVTSTAWGHISKKENEIIITCQSGTLEISSISTNLFEGEIKVYVNGKTIDRTQSKGILSFEKVKLTSGDVLTASLN